MWTPLSVPHSHPVDRPAELSPQAAVAVVLRRCEAGGRHILLIQRSERPSDPWSGQVALPGGRLEAADRDPLAAAVRETNEEVGVDLGCAAVLLGQLPDVPVYKHGRLSARPVRPYVFGLDTMPELRLEETEVAAAFWAPVELLQSGEADDTTLWQPPAGGEPLALPCWRVEGFTIWGMTYRVVASLLPLLPE